MSSELGTLPFDKVAEMALIGHLVKDQKFFSQARHKLKAEWFVGEWNTKTYRALCRFYDEFKRPPTKEEFCACTDIRSEDQSTRNSWLRHIYECGEHTSSYGLDVIRKELTFWMHCRIYSAAVSKSSELFNAQKFPSAYALMTDMVKTISQTNFNEEEAEKMGDWRHDMEQREIDLDAACTFGLLQMDEKLLPEQRRGGLCRGDVTILLAPTNFGKSTALINVAMYNAMRGEKVLYLTHEGRPDDIKLKMWCMATGSTKEEFSRLYLTNPLRLDVAAANLDNNITYVPLNKPNLTVESVIAFIEKKQEELIAATGKGYALVVDDYPAKLGMANGKNFARRQIDEHVYNCFVQMALEQKFHVLCAIQSNREGSKVSKNLQGYEKRLLGMEDVSESWGPMTLATNVITLNRTAKDITTFYIVKSHSTETGWAVACRSRFDKATTHSPKLGCTYYNSNDPLADRIDTLIGQFENIAIPDTTLATLKKDE